MREGVGWQGVCMAWPAWQGHCQNVEAEGAAMHGMARGDARALCVTLGETKLGQTLFQIVVCVLFGSCPPCVRSNGRKNKKFEFCQAFAGM